MGKNEWNRISSYVRNFTGSFRGFPTTSNFLVHVKMTSGYDRMAFVLRIIFLWGKTLAGSLVSEYPCVYSVNCLDFVELQFIPTWETVWKALDRTIFRFYTTRKVPIHQQLANHHRHIRCGENCLITQIHEDTSLFDFASNDLKSCMVYFIAGGSAYLHSKSTRSAFTFGGAADSLSTTFRSYSTSSRW